MKKFVSSLLAASLFAASTALPVYAAETHTTKVPNTVNIACVATAVDARETAVIAAYQTRSTAITTALQTRQTALKAAWALTNAKDRNAAIRAAWSAYRKSFKSANATFRASRNAAWKTFNTARKACGPLSQTSDTGTEGLDNSL
jgi:hypothetical protein